MATKEKHMATTHRTSGSRPGPAEDPEAQPGRPNERRDEMVYTSVDWVVTPGAEAAFVAEATAFQRWLLGQRAGWFVLLQDERDPRRLTSFGVFADMGLAAPRPAFLERLARVRALCESWRDRTYTVATVAGRVPPQRVELNGDALSPAEPR